MPGYGHSPAAGCIFMEGTDSTSQHPQVQFTSFGDYSVRLIAYNSHGSDTLLKTDYISVNASNVDFTSNFLEIVINNNVIFTDESCCDISSYSWDFGSDATPPTANTLGPHTVTYSSTGPKTVSLTVNDTLTESKIDFIEVLPESFNMSDGSLITCSGIFYDPQGTSDYLNSLDYTMTIYPADTSKSIMAVFTFFDLEPEADCGYDYSSIFDGPSVSDSLLGTWCGTTSPDTVVAYRPAGL